VGETAPGRRAEDIRYAEEVKEKKDTSRGLKEKGWRPGKIEKRTRLSL